MAPSATTQADAIGRKRKAQAHGLVEMCLTSGRRAFLSFTWAAKLLQSPKRLRGDGGQLPWTGFNWMQHSYLHQAVIGAARASDAAGSPAGGACFAIAERETQSASARTVPQAAALQNPKRMIDIVDLTFSSDDSDSAGRASPERVDTSRDASAATASSQPTASFHSPALRTSASALASPTFGGSGEGISLGGGGGRDRGTPAALLVARARAGTPLLSALRARLPQPKPSACVATTPVGPASNLQPLTAGDLGRLLRGAGWLNDEVVNFYMLLIMKRESARLASHRAETEATPAAAVPLAVPEAAAPAAAAGPSRSALEAPGCCSPTASGAGRARAGAATGQQERSSSIAAWSEPSPAAAGPGGADKARDEGGEPNAAEREQGAAALPAPAPGTTSPLKKVVSVVATAAGSGAAAVAAAAMAAATTAGLGAVVAAGAKHLAQRQRRKHGQASAPGTLAATATAGTSPVPPATATDGSPMDSSPGSVSSPAPWPKQQQRARQQQQQAAHQEQQQPRSVYAFNSFFFSKLTGKGNRKCFAYGEVRRWTLPSRTHTAECVLTRGLLLFPINHGDSHWCLAAVWPRRRLLQYFDSLGGSRATADWVLDTLLRWLRADAEDKGLDLGSEDPPAAASAGPAGAAVASESAGWRKEFSELHIPQQLDGGSCGVFVCAFAELLARGVPPNVFGFSQADIPSIRRGMAEQILRGSL